MQLLKFLADVVNLQPEFNLPETINTGLASPARLSLALKQLTQVLILCQPEFVRTMLFEIDNILVVQLLPDGRDIELAPNSKCKQGNTYALTLVVHVDILDCHDFLHLRLLLHDQLPGTNHNKKRTSGGAQLGRCACSVYAATRDWGDRGSFKRCVP